jgi:hypothetical protein
VPEETKPFVSLSEAPGFHGADSKLGELTEDLMRFEGIGQMVAELRAGQQYIKAPKARRDFIDELLIKPLTKLDSAAPSEKIRALAGAYLNWLLQLYNH